MSYLSKASIVVLTLATLGSVNAQPVAGEVIPVGVDNFARAESDLYMGNMVKNGCLGRFVHSREPVSIDAQVVIRMMACGM